MCNFARLQRTHLSLSFFLFPQYALPFFRPGFSHPIPSFFDLFLLPLSAIASNLLPIFPRIWPRWLDLGCTLPCLLLLAGHSNRTVPSITHYYYNYCCCYFYHNQYLFSFLQFQHLLNVVCLCYHNSLWLLSCCFSFLYFFLPLYFSFFPLPVFTFHRVFFFDLRCCLSISFFPCPTFLSALLQSNSFTLAVNSLSARGRNVHFPLHLVCLFFYFLFSFFFMLSKIILFSRIFCRCNSKNRAFELAVIFLLSNIS